MERTWSVVRSTRETISSRASRPGWPGPWRSRFSPPTAPRCRCSCACALDTPDGVADSLVAVMVFSASFLTSSATTAKPRPASPARAASMAAFRARRLVWSAMSEMTFMIWPMPSACLRGWSCRPSSPRPGPALADPADHPGDDPAPSLALDFAFSAVSAAWEAFLATSRTVAFISSMAVAVSPTRRACSWAPGSTVRSGPKVPRTPEVTHSTTPQGATRPGAALGLGVLRLMARLFGLRVATLAFSDSLRA